MTSLWAEMDGVYCNCCDVVWGSNAIWNYVIISYLQFIYIPNTEKSLHPSTVLSLRWRYNERHGVWNHQRLDGSCNYLFKLTSKKTTKFTLAALVRHIHRRPVDSPYKGPVTRKAFSLRDVIMPCLVCFLTHYNFYRVTIIYLFIYLTLVHWHYNMLPRCLWRKDYIPGFKQNY